MVVKKSALLFISTIFLSAMALPTQGLAVEESLLVSHEHKTQTPEQKKAQQEKRKLRQSLKIYSKVKNKSWDQLSKKEQAFAKKNGIADEAAYDAWKVSMADAYALQQAKKAIPIYKRVKDKAWDQLSAKEQAFAKKNGIADEAAYDAWKVQMATLVATMKSEKEAAMAARMEAHANGSRNPASVSK